MNLEILWWLALGCSLITIGVDMQRAGTSVTKKYTWRDIVIDIIWIIFLVLLKVIP